jgi:hypothetical protein
MAKSEQINELALALSKVQGEIEGAIKDAMNPAFKSKYADLTSCWEACRQQLTKHQIAVVQSSDDTESHLCLTTTLIHSSGQWIDGTLRMPRMITDRQGVIRNMNAQEIGSALTYFRRYSLCSMVGICPEDDDANTVSQKNDGKNMHHSQQQTCSAMTPYQVLEIEQLLTQCTDEFVKSHHAFLKNTLRVDSMSLVDSRYYHEFKSHALKNIETTKSKVVTLEDKNPPSVFDVKDTVSADKELQKKKEAVLNELKEKKIENAKFGK